MAPTLDRRDIDLGLSESQAQRYSVSRAILSAADKKRDGSSFEGEISRELSLKMGIPPRSSNSIFIPARLRPQQTSLNTVVNAQGGVTVQTTVVDLIDALRQQMRCVQLGAQFAGGLTSNLAFATEVATTAATWVQESPGSDNADQEMSFGTRAVSPHALQSSTSFSRQLLAQNNVDLEARTRLDLMRSHAIAFDQAAINGSGASNQPLGLLQLPLTTIAIGANGGPATYAHICALEQAIGDAHADSSNLGFLTTPAQRAKLRQVFKNGIGSDPVWDDDSIGPLGYVGVVSKAVPSNLTKGSGTNLSVIIAGNFAYMFLAQWGAIEIVVDPFAGKKQGMVQIDAFSLVDVLIKQTGAFAAIVDAT